MIAIQNLFQTITTIIDELRKENPHLLIAIDGRCASGKTTLAKQLQMKYCCNVIPMDHFFLRPMQRTQERLQAPGENIDHERFLEEVLKPLRAGEELHYRPYRCQLQRLSEPITVSKNAINIIEGSYSCHSLLWDFYDMRIFLDVDSKEQLRRIELREGSEKVEIFKSRWIPMEEAYFSAFKILERCDYHFMT